MNETKTPAKKTTAAHDGRKRALSLRWLLGVVGTTLLGAFGSGLWDLVVKPLASIVARFITDAISSVFVGYKESLYQQFLLGQNDSSNAFLLGLLVATGITAIVNPLVHFFPLSKDAAVSASRYRWGVRLRLFWMASAFIAVFFSINAYSRSYYRSTVIANFERAMVITAPLTTDKDRQQLRARFVQVSNRKEYVELMDSLKKVAESNNVKLPAFDVW